MKWILCFSVVAFSMAVAGQTLKSVVGENGANSLHMDKNSFSQQLQSDQSDLSFQIKRDVPAADTYQVTFVVSSALHTYYMLPPTILTWGAGAQAIGLNPFVPGQLIFKSANFVNVGNPNLLAINFKGNTTQDLLPAGSSVNGELLTDFGILIGCDLNIVETDGINYQAPYGYVVNTSAGTAGFISATNVYLGGVGLSYPATSLTIDPWFYITSYPFGFGVNLIQFIVRIIDNPAPKTTGQATTGQFTTGQAVQTTGQAVQTTGQAVQTTGQAVQTTGQAAQTTGQAVQTTGQAVQTTGQAAQTTGQKPTTGQAVQTTGQAVLTTGQAVQTTGQAKITTGQASTGAAQATTGAAVQQTTGQKITTGPAVQQTTGVVAQTTTGPAVQTTGQKITTGPAVQQTTGVVAQTTTGAAVQQTTGQGKPTTGQDVQSTTGQNGQSTTGQGGQSTTGEIAQTTTSSSDAATTAAGSTSVDASTTHDASGQASTTGTPGTITTGRSPITTGRGQFTTGKPISTGAGNTTSIQVSSALRFTSQTSIMIAMLFVACFF